MSRPRPGCEQEQEPRAAVARHGAALGGLEQEERSRSRLGELLVGFDPHGPFKDEDEGVFADLVLTELLPRIETDQDSATLAVRMQDDRGDASPRGLDLAQVPTAHAAMLAGGKPEGGYDALRAPWPSG